MEKEKGEKDEDQSKNAMSELKKAIQEAKRQK